MSNLHMDDDDGEFEESMRKVNLIGGIIKDMSSQNEAKSRIGMLRAEELLGDGEKTWDESSLKTVQNGTTINRRAFEDLGKPKDEIPSDAAGFMAHVERDAKQRSEAKKKEIKRSDYLKTMGNCEYRKGNYEKALIYYNQAIDVRKDSCVLFTNRALTKINLGLMDEVVSDCDRALRLNDRSLNAVLYKAEALWGLDDTRAAEDLLETALKTHPDQTKRIQGQFVSISGGNSTLMQSSIVPTLPTDWLAKQLTNGSAKSCTYYYSLIIISLIEFVTSRVRK